MLDPLFLVILRLTYYLVLITIFKKVFTFDNKIKESLFKFAAQNILIDSNIFKIFVRTNVANYFCL